MEPVDIHQDISAFLIDLVDLPDVPLPFRDLPDGSALGVNHV